MPSSRVGDATKHLLCESLKRKMAVKPLDKISIREIVEDCGTNRQTFYYHFQDIYDQLKWMYEQEAFSLVRDRANMLFWQDGILQLFHYLEENRAVMVCALKSMGHEHVKRFFYDDLRDIVQLIVKSAREQISFTEEYEEFLVHYLTLSFSALTESWILGEIQKTPEELIKLLEITMNDQIHGAILRVPAQK